MNKQERIELYVKMMEAVAEEYRGDPEVAHLEADDLLCELLKETGYSEVVEAWRNVPKWYA